MRLHTIIIIIGTFISYHCIAQNATKDSTVNKNAKNIYLELGGNGIAVSVNYDFRFTKSQKGLGMRVGGMFLGGSEGGFFALPIGLNYLIGKAPNYFETGLGYTYASEAGNFSSGEKISLLVPSVAYRYQPLKNGVTFRAGFDPLIGLTEPGWITWFGLSVGYKF